MVSAAKKQGDGQSYTDYMHYFTLALTEVSAAKKQGDGWSHTDYALLYTSCDHGQLC